MQILLVDDDSFLLRRLLRSAGRGITLIWFAMDEVRWNSRGNRIEMIKQLAH